MQGKFSLNRVATQPLSANRKAFGKAEFREDEGASCGDACWHPALGRQRQEDNCKLKAIWCTKQDPASKKKKKRKHPKARTADVHTGHKTTNRIKTRPGWV